MRTTNNVLFTIIFIYIFSTACATESLSSEIVVSGKDVKIKTDDGEVIDTSKLPESSDIEIDNNTVSIGDVKNNGKNNKNINKKTSIENVIIVKDGKTTSIKKLETGNMRHGTEKK